MRILACATVLALVIARRAITQTPSTLDPGSLHATPNSAGRFALSGVPQGRYFLRVRAIGYASVADSITVGTDGLVVLAVIAEPPGDIEIGCTARPDSTKSRRPR